MLRQGTLLLIALVALGVAGCFPDEMPGYLAGGKVVAALAADANGAKVLWTYDLDTRRSEPHLPPEDWQIQSARMLGDQAWVRLQRQREGNTPAEPTWEYSCMRFDPARKAFVSGPPELARKDWLWGAIATAYQGRKCILRERPGGSYAVYSLPDLERAEELASLHKPMPAGRWWWLQIRPESDEEPGAPASRLDVYNPNGRLACTIWAAEANKAGQELRPPLLARVSADGKAIFLAYGREPYSFGVLDARTGRFLWGGKARSLVGVPIVRRGEVWTLAAAGREEEPPDDPSQKVTRQAVALIRHKSGGEADENGVTGRTVLELPVDADLRSARYAPTPDGSQLVVILEGKPPRLLFIPAKEGVKEEDVRAADLTAEP